MGKDTIARAASASLNSRLWVLSRASGKPVDSTWLMGWKTSTKQKRSSGGKKAQTNRRVRLDAAAAAEQVALGAAQALEPAGQEQAGLLEQGPAGSGLLEQPTTSSSPATSSSSPAVACDCTDSRAHLCAADAVSCLACDQCGMRAPPTSIAHAAACVRVELGLPPAAEYELYA